MHSLFVRLLTTTTLLGLAGAAAAQNVGHIAGRVIDDGTGDPIQDVTVRLPGVETVTDYRGRFRIEAVRPGSYQISLRRLGYADEERTVVVSAGEVAVVTVRMVEQAIPLDSIEARADRSQRQEAERRGTMIRRLTRQQIDSLATETSSMSEIVRRVPGLQVQAGAGLGQPICAESIQRSTHTGGCDMVTVVVDGLVYTGDEARQVLGGISPLDVDHIELFTASEAGLRWGRVAANGVLEVVTRQGQRPAGAPQVPRRTAFALDAGITPGRIIMGGVLGATVGYLGGALAGSAVASEDAFFSSAGLGAVIGTTVTTPLGTHLGSGGAGSLPLKLLTSGILGGIGVAGIEGTDADAAFAILIPIAQVAAITWLETKVLAR